MASLTSCIVSLVKSIYGAGILSLPYAFGQTGLALGTILLFSAAALQVLGCRLLLLSIEIVRSRHASLAAPPHISYETLTDMAFKEMDFVRKAVSACIALGCFGFATSYFIVIGGLCPQIAAGFGAESALLVDSRFWIMTFALGLELPMMCASSLDSLRFSSLVGNLAVVSVAAMTFAYAIGLLGVVNAPAVPVSFFPTATPPYTSAGGMVESLSIFAFAFSCAQNLPSMALELHDPSRKRLDTVTLAAIGVAALTYQLTAWCGASAFGASVDANLLRSFPLSHVSFASAAIGMAARAAVVINVATGYPIYMHVARSSLAELVFQKAPAQLSAPQWWALTAGLFASSLLFALLVRSLDIAVALVGATTAPAMNYLLPALFYLRLSNPDTPTVASSAGDLLLDAQNRLELQVQLKQQGQQLHAHRRQHSQAAAQSLHAAGSSTAGREEAYHEDGYVSLGEVSQASPVSGGMRAGAVALAAACCVMVPLQLILITLKSASD